MEIFKDVRGFEGLYRISNLGNVESYKTQVIGKGKFYMEPKISPIKQFIKNRYYAVVIYKNKKLHHRYVHRLVGECFLEGEQFGLQINHKNKNRLDNRAENLEWCTRQYNSEHGNGKPVIQISKIDGTEIKEYPSQTAAGKGLGIRVTMISNVCRGTRKTAGGYKWKFKNI